MKTMRHFFLALFCWLSFSAHAAVDPDLVAKLAAEESDDKIAAILQIAQTAEPEALTILQSLSEGTLSAPDGSVYEGAFSRGRRNGRGSITFADGRTVDGTFVNDRLVR